MVNDEFLEEKLDRRRTDGNLRELKMRSGNIDFSSNDYLGVVRNRLLSRAAPGLPTGSTGSRLLTGNPEIATKLEAKIAAFHNTEASLIFNSGYDANLGLLSCVPQRGDTIIYDFLSHASIRDGIRLGFATSFSFLHNDVEDLERRLKTATGNIFVVTESVFSMDGDIAPLAEIARVCKQYGAHLIVDEAHATGVVGPAGAGVVQQLGIEEECFVRVVTFGKALGCHGAAVLGSLRLKTFLINFARSLIYTTALPEAALAAIDESYNVFPGLNESRKMLGTLIGNFQSAKLPYQKLISQTPIQGIIVPGNENVVSLSKRLAGAGFNVHPIFYPTVPKRSERLRIIVHSFNTLDELGLLINMLAE